MPILKSCGTIHEKSLHCGHLIGSSADSTLIVNVSSWSFSVSLCLFISGGLTVGVSRVAERNGATPAAGRCWAAWTFLGLLEVLL